MLASSDTYHVLINSLISCRQVHTAMSSYVDSVPRTLRFNILYSEIQIDSIPRANANRLNLISANIYKTTMIVLNSLPHELVDMIMESLPMRDKCHLALTCRDIYIRNAHFIRWFSANLRCMKQMYFKYLCNEYTSARIYRDYIIMSNYDRRIKWLSIINYGSRNLWRIEHEINEIDIFVCRLGGDDLDYQADDFTALSKLVRDDIFESY